MLSFLGKRYENLVTCDLICHGVPSKKIIDKYINDKEKEYKSKLKEILFRDKINGWNNMRITLTFENGKRYSQIASYDDFYFGFLEAYIIESLAIIVLLQQNLEYQTLV